MGRSIGDQEIKGFRASKGEQGWKESLQSYKELPPMLMVPDIASVLGVRRAGAYELAHSEGFSALKVRSRIVIPKDKFLLWIEKQCGGEV